MKMTQKRVKENACIDEVHALLMEFNSTDILLALKYLGSAEKQDVPSLRVRSNALDLYNHLT